MERTPRKPYPSDVSDEEWAFVAPYLTLMREDAPQRVHALREVFNGLRWIVRGRAPVALDAARPAALADRLPADAALAGRRRASRRSSTTCARCCGWREGRAPRADGGDLRQPDAAVHAGERRRAPATTGTSGARAARCTWRSTRWGTCWRCTSPRPTRRTAPRSATLAAAVQEATGEAVEVAFVDQGYTGEHAAADAAAHGIRLEVVKLPEAKRGFVLLPRRWVVERSFAWTARFRRLARDYERLHTTLEGLHTVAFALLALNAVRAILAVL